MRIFNFIALLVCLTYFSCKENSSVTDTQTKEISASTEPLKIEKSQDLNWLQGSWISEDKSTIETWAVQGDSLAGNLYSGAVKRIIEILTIKQVGKSWIYKSKGLQKDGKNILLDLETYNSKQLVFYNPMLDYPNKVDYTRIDDKTIQITISGKSNQPASYKMFKLD